MGSMESTGKISRYELLSRLGEGGIGVVYKAMDPALSKIVAIKVLNTNNLSADQQIRFQNEARALAELKHEGIPEIYDFSVSEDGAPYMVMEFINGESLNVVISNEENRTVDFAVSIAIQICEALQHAHAAGIRHRDVKPSNVIITEDKKVKLVDFGLAKIEKFLNSDQFKTEAGMVMGSPLYMSPEQFQSGHVDARTDIYSLGCVLFETLSGAPPFFGETALETANMHMSRRPPLLPEDLDCSETVRDDLQKIINRCLEKKPEDRFQKMHELRLAFEKIFPSEVEQTAGDTTTPLGRTLVPLMLAGLVIVGLAVVTLIMGGISFEKETESLLKKVVVKPAVTVKDSTTITHAMPEEGTWLTRERSPKAQAGPDVKDEDFKLLQTDPNRKYIKRLVVEHSTVTGDGLRHLRGLNLESIKIDSPNLSDKAIKHLHLFPRLYDLQLGKSKELTLGSYKIIGRSQIRELKFGSMPVPDDGFAEIAKMPRLKSLILRNLASTKLHVDYVPIATMRNLEFLEIMNFDFSSKDITVLKPLKKITGLALVDLDITDDNLEVLQALPYLNYLNLSLNKITKAGLEKAAGIKSLAVLDIKSCPLLTKAEIMAFKFKHKKLSVLTEEDVEPGVNGEELTRNYLDRNQQDH
ncbi:MAG: protein kinase [Candidatus Melainabacteria bacterium]|nr:protein kinase [Candidatus Melainabacteria bacterium]